MFGWEFPPFKSGGLGTACYDLTKGLSCNNVEVIFVMPFVPNNADGEYVKLISAKDFSDKIKIRGIKTLLTPYQSEQSYAVLLRGMAGGHANGAGQVYGANLYSEVYRYSVAAGEIAKEEKYDVIHSHDWMTYGAGINAKRKTGKPLVVHIHATEFDRTGGNPNNLISSIEYSGLAEADKIIANSNFTKQNVIKHYNIEPQKIEVVHWGIDQENPHYALGQESPFKGEKIVLFLGRITIQKGPDYFVEAAAKVLQHEPKTRFVMAGSGDMFERMIERAAELGILERFVFTGFLNGADVHKAFQMADLYVMPSVSEPFGLVALEALKNKTPILISKQSGVSEVVNHALKTDFWDVDEMTNKIVSVLRYSELSEELKENGHKEVQSMDIYKPAQKTKRIYEQLIASVVR
jgi:glycosyltransferase involved in cell wall biosynthesis